MAQIVTKAPPRGLLIGADPELAVQNMTTGRYLSAHDLIYGTKQEPSKVRCGAIQVDGVAAEFNIDPASSPQEFLDNILAVVDQMTFQVQMKNPDAILVAEPAAVFDKTYWDEIVPDENKELGCEPDFNAWEDGKANPRPDATGTMRSFGGHIHLGWRDPSLPIDQAHEMDALKMVRQLDYALYPPSLLWDNDDTRRRLYGRRGAHRIKPYGVEYRVLSNAWLRSPETTKWVFGAAQAAFNLAEDDCWLFSIKNLQKTFNKSKPSKADLRMYASELAEWTIPELPQSVYAF